MTPLGHISIAYISGRKLIWSLFLPFLIGSILPDIDFILLPFNLFNSYHRIVTHNIFFIFLCSAIITILYKHKRIFVFLLVLSGSILHLLTDSVMDNNPSNGIGVTLFWPFSFYRFSPFNIFHGQNNIYTWNEPFRFIKANLKYFVIEIPFIVISLFMVIKKRISKPSV